MSSQIQLRSVVEPTGFLRKYIFSTNHKVVGLQYFSLSLFAVVTGMALSWLMRIHVAWSGARILGLEHMSATGAPGGVMTPEYYLSLMTLHGTIMIFFVLTLAPQNAFGNYFLPLQIGAEETAFPFVNMLSFWTTLAAFLVLLATLFVKDGPPISGWTAYPPMSAVGKDAGPGLGTGQNLWILSIGIFCIASIASSVNFMVTFIDMRSKGMWLLRLPLTCWAWFITAILSLLSFAVLLAAVVLLFLDRTAGTSFFLPANLLVSGKIEPHSGGSPLLWQHLFWFFGHPEVYITILPGFGIVSHVLACFSRKPILGYRLILGCMLAIGFLSFVVWGHHMFVSGMSPFSGFLFSIPTIIISLPATITTLLWLSTLWGGKLQFNTAMMFCLGFISTFVAGGLGGILLAHPAVDSYLHATYFVVGHLHMVMGVSAIFAIFAAIYFWYPKMFGRMLSERLGLIHFGLTFLGVYCIFMPMHLLGFSGNPRRYAMLSDDFLLPLIPLHKFITVAALITGAVQLIFLFNLFWSMYKGRPASENPWNATSLEWSTSSPPPNRNFVEQPIVNHGAYEYGQTGLVRDFVMQSDPENLKVTE
ncbi:MAG: cytochrome c oxidase subunit I [Acidobacteria bacterium]|nr:MAG: cytochrome c oxidase subunit I [Acidobacteriota bacterium]PYY22136.1 MAG: cytochrome c oxidase subunit I [Acidobacteriota bacterium]